MAHAKTLHVCNLNRGGAPLHACWRAHHALQENGHGYETNVFDRNRPFGLFTSGRRPKLKEMSGQEKLPVLELDDGTFVIGSSDIMDWAERNPPGGQAEHP
jgi:glutathione S-transferase